MSEAIKAFIGKNRLEKNLMKVRKEIMGQCYGT